MFVNVENDAGRTEYTEETPCAEATGLKRAEYFRQVKAQLRAGQQKEALSLLQWLIMFFPNEPVFLSYYGYLIVLVERRYRKGIETCLTALKGLQTCRDFDAEALYPVFYCNLGRAYAMAGKRKEAVEALDKGLSYDRSNKDIIKELQFLGTRRKTLPIPFLKRTNPLNIVIGVMSYKKSRSRRNAEPAKRSR